MGLEFVFDDPLKDQARHLVIFARTQLFKSNFFEPIKNWDRIRKKGSYNNAVNQWTEEQHQDILYMLLDPSIGTLADKTMKAICATLRHYMRKDNLSQASMATIPTEIMYGTTPDKQKRSSAKRFPAVGKYFPQPLVNLHMPQGQPNPSTSSSGCNESVPLFF